MYARYLCVWCAGVCPSCARRGQVLAFRNTLSTIALSLRPSLTRTFYLNKPKDGGRYGMDGGVTDTTIHRPLIGRSDFKTKGRGAWAVRVGGAGARWGARRRHENHLNTKSKKSTNVERLNYSVQSYFTEGPAPRARAHTRLRRLSLSGSAAPGLTVTQVLSLPGRGGYSIMRYVPRLHRSTAA